MRIPARLFSGHGFFRGSEADAAEHREEAAQKEGKKTKQDAASQRRIHNTNTRGTSDPETKEVGGGRGPSQGMY